MVEEGAYLAVLGGASWAGVLVAGGPVAGQEGAREEGLGVGPEEVPGAADGELDLVYQRANQEAS